MRTIFSGLSYCDKRPILTDKKPIKYDKFESVNVSANEIKILDFLKTNMSVTNSEVRSILNVSESTSKRLLGEMSKKGLITAVGERKGRKYILNN